MWLLPEVSNFLEILLILLTSPICKNKQSSFSPSKGIKVTHITTDIDVTGQPMNTLKQIYIGMLCNQNYANGLYSSLGCIYLIQEENEKKIFSVPRSRYPYGTTVAKWPTSCSMPKGPPRTTGSILVVLSHPHTPTWILNQSFRQWAYRGKNKNTFSSFLLSLAITLYLFPPSFAL